MKIFEVPGKFRPKNNVPYPSHQVGEQIEDRVESMLRHKMLSHTIKTDRYYLPIKWTAYHIKARYGQDRLQEKGLQDYVNALPKSERYFTVVQYDDGCMVDFPFDCKVYSAGGEPGNGIPIPLVCDPLPKIKEVKKDIAVSFLANTNTHPIRKKIADTMRGMDDCYVGRHASRMYAEILQRSKFTVCPRGYGKTSFRLYEAIQLGTIPIYVSDEHWLPYRSLLNWASFSLLFTDNANFFETIRDCIEMGDVEYQEMVRNLESVQRMLTYDGIVDEIVRDLSAEYYIENPDNT